MTLLDVLVAMGPALWTSAIVLICTVWLFRRSRVVVNKDKSTSSSPSDSSAKFRRIMIVLGSGGHTAEMLRLLSAIQQASHPQASLAFLLSSSDTLSLRKAKEATRSLSKQTQFVLVPRSREVGQSYLSSVFTTLYATVHTVPQVLWFEPDLVVTNGPGTCVPVLFAAWIRSTILRQMVTSIYVESICRIKTMSLSGKIANYLCDRVVVQWPKLHEAFPGTAYLGRLT